MKDTGFPERLRQAREKAGFTTAEAAKGVGVSPAEWQSWESGSDVPGYTLGCHVSVFLECDPLWLATGSAELEPA